MNDCPYVGLVPFEKSHAPYFFGRGEDIQRIIANLSAHKLTLLYGPSGVGKSSVLNAGVIAAIDRANEALRSRDEVPDWEVVAFRNWQFSPAAGLVRVLAEGCAANVPDLPVCHDPSFHQLLLDYFFTDSRVACAHERENVPDLLIILDQFEEFFLYHDESAEGRFFLDEIVASIMDRRLRAGFMISMRDDSLAKLDVFKSRIPFLFDNRLSLDPLTEAGAREAITLPLGVFNANHDLKEGASWTIEAALLDQVIGEVRDGKLILGDAPMGDARLREEKSRTTSSVDAACLQMVMSRLWTDERSSKSTTLRVMTFERLGRSKGIIGSHLGRILNGVDLSDKDRRIAAQISRHLVTSSNSKIAHNAQALADLTGLDASAIRSVLEKLARPAARILRTVEAPGDEQEPRYEVFHDLLGRALIDWRKRYFDKQRVGKFLISALVAVSLVVGFAALAYHFNSLKGKAEQAEAKARNWAIRELAAWEKTKIAEQRADDLEKRSSELARQAAETTTQLNFANQDRQRVLEELTATVNQAKSTEARTQELETFYEKIKDSLADNPARSTPAETSGPRLITLGGHAGSIWQGIFSSNGRHFATACEDGFVRFWRVRGAEGEFFAKPASIFAERVAGGQSKVGVWRIALDSGRNLLAAAPVNEPVRIYLIDEDENKRQVASIPVGNDLTEMVFIPTRRRFPALMTATQGTTIQSWSLESPAGSDGIVPKATDQTTQATTVSEIAFSSTGKFALVSAHNGKDPAAVNLVVLELPATGARPRISYARAFSAPTRKMVFDPVPGSTVIAGGMGRQVLIADFMKPREAPALLTGHGAAVWEVAFSPDGKTLASVAADGKCLLWNVGSRTLKAELPSQVRGRVFTVAWSSENVLALGGEDGWVWMWRMRKDGSPGRSFSFPGHIGPVSGVKFSPDGKQLASWTRTLTADFLPKAAGKAAETGAKLPLAADSNAILWDVSTSLPPAIQIVEDSLRSMRMPTPRPDSDIRKWFGESEKIDKELGLPVTRADVFIGELQAAFGNATLTKRDLLEGRYGTPRSLADALE